MRNVLALPWDDLTLEERVNAMREARRAGGEAAAADRGAGGAGPDGVEEPVAEGRHYYACVLEPAFHAGDIDEAVLDAWKDELVVKRSLDDPRVQAFCDAWAASQYEATLALLEDREGEELLGQAEVAELLGWDPRKVGVYAGRPGFPAPVAELRMGRVWRRSDIERYRDTQLAGSQP